LSFRRCKFSIERGKFSIERGKVAIDRGEFSNQRVPFSTRRVQVPRNPWRFALVRCWGARGGGQHRSGDGPSPRRSHSVNRASCDFVSDFVRVHVRFVQPPSRRAAKSTHGARLRDVATPLRSVVLHVRSLAFRLILLIARVPNLRQTICESMCHVSGGLGQDWCCGRLIPKTGAGVCHPGVIRRVSPSCV
jgi:hypothetical protein